MKLSDFLQVKDAAAFLGVSTDTIRRWDRAGKLSSVRHPINNYRLYRLQALQEILADLKNRSEVLHYE